MSRPKIVCLCGSTRFRREFMLANHTETLAGRIVLSVGCFVHASEAEQPPGLDLPPLTEDDKVRLDELHLRKIDLADEVLVLNVGGYVGTSTRREVNYAHATGKPIRWLEHFNG